MSVYQLDEGLMLYQQQRYLEAEEKLIKASGSVPNSGQLWRTLGLSQMAQGKFDLAEVNIGKAIALDSKDGDSYYALGLVHSQQHQWDKAAANFQEALTHKPNDNAAKEALSTALVYRGTLALQNDDYQHGEHDLEMAMKLNRTSHYAPVALANHFIKVGQEARAKQVVTAALPHLSTNSEMQALATKLGISYNVQIQAATQQVSAKAAIQAAQEVACPCGKAKVMEWATICPHCSRQIKANPTGFAHLKQGPSVAWQDVAYMVVSGIYCLASALPVIAFAMRGLPIFELPYAIVTIWAGANFLLAIGLLFQNEFCQWWAFRLSILGCLRDVLGILISWGNIPAQLLSLFSAGISGFMAYLISYVGDP